MLQTLVGPLAHHLLDFGGDLSLLPAHEGVDFVGEGFRLDLGRFVGFGLEFDGLFVGQDGVEVFGGFRGTPRFCALLGVLLEEGLRLASLEEKF